MTVSTIANITATISRISSVQDAKPAAVLKSLFAANPAPKNDTADFTTAISLQNQIAQFRVASQGIAQGNSVLAAADAGASDIARELGKLKDLAAKAANIPLSATERMQIDAEFQAIRSRIRQIAATTSFNNEPLLDGTSQLSVQADAQSKAATLKSLTDEALFKGANPSLLSIESSKLAEDAVKVAQKYVAEQLEALTSLQSGLDFAATTLQTAIQNQDASNSTLDDDDLTLLLLGGSGNAVQTDINAQVAQTARLPNNLLQLLNE